MRVVVLALGAALFAVPVSAKADEPVADPPVAAGVHEPQPGLGWGLVAALYAGMFTYTYFDWYAGTPSSRFRFVDEGLLGRNTYAGGMDKVGHAYVNVLLVRGASQLLDESYALRNRWARTLLAAGLSMGFYTYVEIGDGTHAGFGFSATDLLADAVGVALGSLLELCASCDRLVDFKWGYVPSATFAARPSLAFAEDYNGQRYALTVNLDPLRKALGVPDSILELPGLYVGAAFSVRGYEPAPDAFRHEQTLSLVVGFKPSRLVARARQSDLGPGWGRRVLDYAEEAVMLPYVTAFSVPLASRRGGGEVVLPSTR
jgi:hypothetical protein